MKPEIEAQPWLEAATLEAEAQWLNFQSELRRRRRITAMNTLDVVSYMHMRNRYRIKRMILEVTS